MSENLERRPEVMEWLKESPRGESVIRIIEGGGEEGQAEYDFWAGQYDRMMAQQQEARSRFRA